MRTLHTPYVSRAWNSLCFHYGICPDDQLPPAPRNDEDTNTFSDVAHNPVKDYPNPSARVRLRSASGSGTSIAASEYFRYTTMKALRTLKFHLNEPSLLHVLENNFSRLDFTAHSSQSFGVFQYRPAVQQIRTTGSTPHRRFQRR